MSTKPEIIVFSAPNCGECVKTKTFLTNRGVKYTEKNVSTDDAAMEVVRGLGYRSLPVVMVGDKHWAGHRLSDLISLK